MTKRSIVRNILSDFEDFNFSRSKTRTDCEIINSGSEFLLFQDQLLLEKITLIIE